MSQGRTLPESLAYRLLSRNDRADTPTADSRVFIAPPPPLSEPPMIDPDAIEEEIDDPSATPTWRPPHASPRVPSEPVEAQRVPFSAFGDEAESTIRDRLPPGLVPSSPPSAVPTTIPPRPAPSKTDIKKR